MALAKITKAEQAAAARRAYIAYEVEHLSISGDDHGAFAVVQSQSQDIVYKVYFAEPRNAASHAVSCECDGFYYRKKCVHCEIVNTYHSRIHDLMHRPVDISFDAYVAALEAIYHVEEVAPVVPTACPVVVKAKKPRRSAVNVDLVAALQVKAGVRVRKVRKDAKENAGVLVAKGPVVVAKKSIDCPAVVLEKVAA